MKQNIIVLYGGQSVEHDISIITAMQTLQAIKIEQQAKTSALLGYNFFAVYISREGKWYFGNALNNMQTYKNFNPKTKGIAEVKLACGQSMLLKMHGKKTKPFIDVHMGLICNHGKGGEDGTLQGLLQSCNIPFTSCGVLSSAICMDKITTKHILKANGFNQTNFFDFTRAEWKQSSINICAQAEALGFPLVVKPSNLGSSIGISVCHNQTDFIQAVHTAKHFDFRILAEQAVTNLRELNCSVMGNSLGCTASEVEEPVGWTEFLSFEQKYLSNGKLAGMQSAKRVFPAAISPELRLKVQTLSKQAFMLLCCKGVVRVDFLLNNASGELYLNEVNTVPGSLSFYLWKNKFSHGEMILKLISYAKEDEAELGKNSTVFYSKALDQFGNKNKLK